jgi:hypothetical protein
VAGGYRSAKKTQAAIYLYMRLPVRDAVPTFCVDDQTTRWHHYKYCGFDCVAVNITSFLSPHPHIIAPVPTIYYPPALFASNLFTITTYFRKYLC